MYYKGRKCLQNKWYGLLLKISNTSWSGQPKSVLFEKV